VLQGTAISKNIKFWFNLGAFERIQYTDFEFIEMHDKRGSEDQLLLEIPPNG